MNVPSTMRDGGGGGRHRERDRDREKQRQRDGDREKQRLLRERERGVGWRGRQTTSILTQNFDCCVIVDGTIVTGDLTAVYSYVIPCDVTAS